LALAEFAVSECSSLYCVIEVRWCRLLLNVSVPTSYCLCEIE